MAAVRSAELMEKMHSTDKDFRFMAVNDVIESFKNKTITLDDNSESLMIENLLNLLSDPSAEVQNLVVRCIAIFVNHLSGPRLYVMLDKLCDKMAHGNSNTRDIAAIAMRMAVTDFDSVKQVELRTLIEHIFPRLVKILGDRDNCDDSVNEQVLEVMGYLLRKGSKCVEFQFSGLCEVLFQHTENARSCIRKRAQVALSYFAEVADQNVFDVIMVNVHDGCTKHKDNAGMLKNYVLTTTAICRFGGQRFATHLPQFMELFLNVCDNTENDELREVIMGAFEVFCQKCPDASIPFLPRVRNHAVTLLSYDPNYSYDESDNEEAMDVDDAADADSDDDGDSDYSDDEDMSWKVRHAAAKLIEAMISSGHDHLHEDYQHFGPLLVKRLKEREDNVKMDIMSAILALLKQTRVLLPETIVPLSLRGELFNYEAFQPEQFKAFINDDSNPRRQQVFADLHELLPLLISRLGKLQRTKNVKIMEQMFVLLGFLLLCYPGAIGNSISILSPSIKYSLNDRDGNIKIATLRFLTAYFFTHNYAYELQEYQYSLNEVIKIIFRLSGESFSKVASESVEVVNALIRSLGHIQNADGDVVQKIYDLLLSKLQVADMDQEVKEKVIAGAGYLIANFGDKLGGKAENMLHVLTERLDNEVSRTAVLRALTVAARSEHAAPLRAIAPSIVNHAAEFLRKTNRGLRIATLNLVIAMADRADYHGIDSVNLVAFVNEIPILLSDSDLQIAHLSLRFMTLAISVNANGIGNVAPVVKCVVELSKSSLVQGTAQKAVLDFLSALIPSRIPSKPIFRDLITNFMELTSRCSQLSRNAYITIAKCIATVARASNNAVEVVPLTKELEKCVFRGQNEVIKVVGILTLGEIGRVFPTVYDTAGAVDPAAAAVKCFSAPTEDLKMMASHALGALAVGNIPRFLPFILGQIKEQPARQYLLIYALRELITSDSTDATSEQLFVSQIGTVWNVLVQQGSVKEEGTRMIVAECLAKLCLIDAEKYLPLLVKCFNDNNPAIRATALVGIRYMIHDKPLPVDDQICNVLPTFLAGLSSVDIDILRLTIVLVNTVAHHKPDFIRNRLDSILPSIYRETKPRYELQHEVEMGPFKHLVDDGLELRKSAFECLYTLVEHCLDRLAMHEFITYIQEGLKDNSDIKQLTCLTLIRLSETCPHHVAQNIEPILELMKQQLLVKLKQHAVKQDNDQLEDIKRAVVRSIVSFKNMGTTERLQRVNEMYDWVSSEFSYILADIRQEFGR